MLKVLIVDDELKVCNLIYHLLDWSTLGLEVIGRAQDGGTAYNFVLQNKPDIIITDIRIPEIDGIKLIEKVKEVYPETYFIIISGYNHFEYAQKAIKFGVEDYILKPVKKKDLTEALTRLISKHSDKTTLINEKTSMLNRISTADEWRKRNFLDELLHKKIQDMSIDTINRTYHCGFIDGFYQVAVIKPTLPFHEEYWQSYELLMQKTLDIVNRDLNGSCTALLTTLHPEGVVCLANGTEEQINELKRRLKKIKITITYMRDAFTDVNVTIGMGCSVTDTNNIPDSIDSAKAAALERFVTGLGNIIEVDRVNVVIINDFVDSSFRNKIMSCIEILNGEEIKKHISDVYRRVLEHPDTCGKLIFDLYSEITDIFVFGLKSNSIPHEHLNFTDTSIRSFHACGTSKEAFKYLGEKINAILLQISEENKQKGRKPIRYAKQYIQDNFNSPITLEEVSKVVGFNPTYFSSVFKKETGKSFTEYLTDLRIYNAKLLLTNTDDNLFDITENVGYRDLKYFSKLFKKNTGLSPSDFRKLYQ
ncbi:MAG: response regulator [Defluviitaleaceae bacterium]|nr:response regulator [Defluviitaleaceae bacterium]